MQVIGTCGDGAWVSERPSRRLLVKAVGACPLALVAGMTTVSASAQPAELPPRSMAMPLSYFGLHMHDPETPWPPIRFGRLRLWDTRTSWMHLQPERDRWEFARLDQFVALARRAGVAPVLPLGLTPTWASSRPLERSPYNVPGAAAEPTNLDDWRQYVRTVAQRYRGRIAHYEIWNEVNAGTGFFSGPPQAMLELQRVAYEELKSVDASITVISPSVEGSTEDKFVWFERYMALMRGRFADVIAYHFYNPRHPPEGLPDLVRRVRAIADRHGAAGLPIWNTESGYRIDWGNRTPVSGTWATWPNLSPERAAAWMVRAYLLGWLAGLDAYFWYAYDNKVMGMTPSSRTAGPLTQAMDAAVSLLVGRVASELRIADGVASVLVQSGSGPCHWVWTTQDDDRLWSPPGEWRARYVAPMGAAAAPITQQRLVVSGMPVLLAGSAQVISV